MVNQISCCVGDLKIEIHVTFKEPLGRCEVFGNVYGSETL